MSFMSVDHLASLKLGDTLSTPWPLVGLDPTQDMNWCLVEIDATNSYIFDLSFYGVRLGQVAAMVREGVVELEDMA